MNAEALKALYEGQLTADIEPPIAGTVDRSGMVCILPVGARRHGR